MTKKREKGDTKVDKRNGKCAQAPMDGKKKEWPKHYLLFLLIPRLKPFSCGGKKERKEEKG